MKILLLFISFFYSSQLISQDFDHIEYKQDVNKAYVLALSKSKYKSALKSLESSHKKYGLLYGEEYALKAYCHKMMGDSQKCAESMRDLWSNKVFDWTYLFEIEAIRPPNLIAGFTDKENEILYEGYENGKKLPIHAKADSILLILNDLLELDQEVRYKEPYDSNKTRIVDSLNQIEFKKIILEYGYPGEWFAPRGKGGKFNVLLLHFSDNIDFFNAMDAVLLEEVKKGHMSPSDYLYWLDRHTFQQEKKSLYGFFMHPKAEIPSNEIIISNRLKFGVVFGFPIPATTFGFN